MIDIDIAFVICICCSFYTLQFAYNRFLINKKCSNSLSESNGMHFFHYSDFCCRSKFIRVNAASTEPTSVNKSSILQGVSINELIDIDRKIECKIYF